MFTVCPGFVTTNITGRSSHFGCLTPMTAAINTAGCPTAAFSRSIELIHSPPDLDEVLHAIGDLHVAVGVDGGDVAGRKPAVTQRRGLSPLKYAPRSTGRAPAARPRLAVARQLVAVGIDDLAFRRRTPHVPACAMRALLLDGGRLACFGSRLHACRAGWSPSCPTPCRTSTPIFCRRTSRSCAAAWPSRRRRALHGRERRPCCSMCCSRPSQMVGTPALHVTRFALDQFVQARAVELRTGQHQLAPPIAAA